MDNATHDPQTSSKQQIYEAILRDLETVNPLEDKAFRILLADTGVFSLVVNAITGDSIEPNCLYVFNNTIVLTVDGKGVVLDTVLESDGFIYNIEGQNEAKDFTFKRHLYYWAIIFVRQLESGGKYEDLKAVTSIVIYKDKGNSPNVRRIGLDGPGDDPSSKNLLRLFSVNSKRWKESENEEMKVFLSIIHNGVLTEKNKHLFDGIDIASDLFLRLNRTIRIACSKYRLDENKVKGDAKMASLYTSFITEEEKEAAISMGRTEGEIKGKIELLHKEFNYPVENIAKLLNIPSQKVSDIIRTLK